MRDYSKMSKRDINKSIARLIHSDIREIISIIGEDAIQVVYTQSNVTRMSPVIDYCNNWADAGPLMVDNKISLSPSTIRISRNEYIDSWGAVCDVEKYSDFINDKNPMRAIAVCSLMIKEGEG